MLLGSSQGPLANLQGSLWKKLAFNATQRGGWQATVSNQVSSGTAVGRPVLLCVLEPSAQWLPFLWSEASWWATAAGLIRVFFLSCHPSSTPGFLGVSLTGHICGALVIESCWGSAGCLAGGSHFLRPRPALNPMKSIWAGVPSQAQHCRPVCMGRAAFEIQSSASSPSESYLCARSGSCPPERRWSQNLPVWLQNPVEASSPPHFAENQGL